MHARLRSCLATILALLAFPALFVSAIMMTLDLLLGTSFFMPGIVSQGKQLGYGGGSPFGPGGASGGRVS